MDKLKRIFNQNRKMFFIIIIVLAVCFIGLRLINYIVKIQNEENSNSSIDTSRTYDRDYAISSGEKLEENAYILESNLIDRFLEYSNNKDFESAYDLVSQECKDVLYPTLESFIEDYSKIFDSKKSYNIQAWEGNIYRVKITEDLLTTGNAGDNNYIEEYISVIGSKLNIRSFLGTIEKNNQIKNANVVIRLEQIDVYMEYSILKLSIFNGRDTSIMLNSEEYADNVYLLDDNDIKYVPLLHELSQDKFIIEAGEGKEISMRFNIPNSKIYNIQYFNMDNIIANYEQYMESGNSRIIQISMEL